MSTTNKSLKQALQDEGLTVKDFANISDTSIKTIYHWVNGESRTPGISLKCLAMHLEIKRLNLEIKRLNLEIKRLNEHKGTHHQI